MESNDLKKVFDFMLNEEKVKSVVNLMGDEANMIYESFAGDILVFYRLLNEENKRKMVELITVELNKE